MRNSVALGFLVLVLVACDGGGNGRQTAPASPSTTTTPPTTAAGAPVDVRVYFARDEDVATAGRAVGAPAVARGALRALLDGPNALERDAGFVSAVPDGTRLLGVDIDDGLATVDLDARFERGGGSLSMTLRVAQVVFTVTQFPTVDLVTIRIDGRRVDAIGGEGVPARDLTRADFERVTPFVLVESPVPGATVVSPVTLSGLSNTFESTVNYSITAPSGALLADGFTTATAGNGTWGTFEATVEFAASPTPGAGLVTAYEIDARTGGRRNVYEVPVRFG